MRRVFGLLRLVLSVGGITALVGDFDYTLGFPTFVISNFFSYFTVQSAFAGVLVFAMGAAVAFDRIVDPGWFDAVRAVVTTYIVISGIIFALIVAQSSSRDYRIDVPWSSQLLHFWIPAVALLDWFLAPGTRRLSWRTCIASLVFPVVWGTFTLIRGGFVGWYPYFFFDPRQVTGWETAIYCVISLAIIVAVASGLVISTRVPRVWRLKGGG